MKRQIEVTKVYEKNQTSKSPVIVNIGGARSSKSYSLAQLFIQKFNNEKGKNFLTTRKTLPSLRLTAYKVAVDLMKDYGLYSKLIHNKSERTIINPRNGNFWVFTSIDSPEKIKSNEFNYIHMEEANEFTYDDYMILKLRMSGQVNEGEVNQMFLSLNPVDEHGWIEAKLMTDNGAERIESTYLDNLPFLPKDYVRQLEGLKDQDDSYYKIYTLGQYAKVTGTIHDVKITNKFPDEFKEFIYGLDFGYINPNALLWIGIDIENMALYLKELLYETNMTNADLKERLKILIPLEHRKKEMYADSSEPARIEEIYQEGFNIKESDKSVLDGIEFLNRFTLYSLEDNVNLNREFRGYKRKVDRSGKTLEDPVKFNDHFPNAARYAAYTHLRERFLHLEPSWVHHKGMAKKPMPTPEEDKIWPPKAMEEKKPKPPPTPKEEESDDESWVV